MWQLIIVIVAVVAALFFLARRFLRRPGSRSACISSCCRCPGVQQCQGRDKPQAD